jgi:hypothetical protein
VKPTRPDISTNLVVNTDRRTYHRVARQTKRPGCPAFPGPIRGAIHAPRVRRPRRAIPPEAERQLPLRLAGRQPALAAGLGLRRRAPCLCRLPAGIAQGEMPPLFVIGADGALEIVNTRVHGNVLIVDRLFGAAELRLGRGPRQEVVRILRIEPQTEATVERQGAEQGT